VSTDVPGKAYWVLRQEGGGSAPVEGRAPHARDVGMTPTHMSAPFGHQPFPRPSVIMTSPGLRPARICGRGDRAPPRKSPFASSPGFPPQGHLALDGPPRGGAGSARPQTRFCFHRWIAPLGHLLFALLSVIMTCLGLGMAAQCGRTECVPPTKPPFALSPGPPRKAISPRPRPLGGAGSARPQCRHNAKRNVPSFRAPASFQLVRNHDLPRPASGLATRARRPRPSEKIALRIGPWFSP